jgi:transcriptional regulator with XRE-family HTH domain
MNTNYRLVKHRRKELGLTQEQLGQLVNQDQSMVAHIEAGRYQITYRYLPLYASALQVKQQELVIFEN